MNPDVQKIKAVVFDCDGVLFDTSLANRKYYDEVLAAFGKPPLNKEQFVNVHMMTVREAIEYLFSDMSDLTEVYDRLASIGYQKFTEYMVMEKGLTDLLTRLKAKGFIRGIATNRTNTMEKVLADFDLADCFEVVMTAAKVKNPKPDPEQLFRIMDLCRLRSEEILFIGDSEYDRRAAAGAGVWFAAYKNPDLKGNWNVSAMDEIADILKIN